MSGNTPLSNLLRIAAVLFVAYALVYAITPFSTSTSVPHFTLGNFRASGSESSSGFDAFVVPHVHCSAPVIDAWRAPSAPSGWFGYAPLTKTPLVAGAGCRETSRHRLALSGFGVILACALVLVARRIDRRPGFGLDPAPG